MADDDLGGLMPRGEVAQGVLEGGDQGIIHDDAGFKMQGFDLEDALFAVGFGVEAAYEGVIVEDGQCEIAVLALGSGCIDFDFVVEVEEFKGTGAIPDERVEGREEGGG